MAAMGAAGGFVVTSGRFTREATEFTSGRNIRLLEGAVLLDFIKQAQAAYQGAKPKAGELPKDAVRPATAQ
jgi:restriction system protein